MVHGDDRGLVLPPRIAPIHVVVVPIWRTEERAAVEAAIAPVEAGLRAQAVFGDQRIRVRVDRRDDVTPGYKFNDWSQRVPIRLEVGPRDVAMRTVVVVERLSATDDASAKESVSVDHPPADIAARLERMQTSLLERAITFQRANTRGGSPAGTSSSWTSMLPRAASSSPAGAARPPANARSRPQPAPRSASSRSRISSRGLNLRAPVSAVARRLQRRRCLRARTDRRWMRLGQPDTHDLGERRAGAPDRSWARECHTSASTSKGQRGRPGRPHETVPADPPYELDRPSVVARRASASVVG